MPQQDGSVGSDVYMYS